MKQNILLALLFFLLTNVCFAQNQEYRIPDIRLDVEIREDGIVQIVERRTYEFRGSFSWADYRLPKRGFSEIRNIRVFEKDSSFINRNNEQPGTFSVSENDDTVIVKWHYSATDTNRIFTISYNLSDAISIGPNWSEFFWNFIASDREKSTENLDITINFPESISADSLYAWLRTSADQTEINKSIGSIIITAHNLSRNQSLEVRTAFPSTVFDRNIVSITDPDLTLEWIQNDEDAYIRKQQQQVERQEYFDSITLEITVLICVLGIAVFLFFFRKYGTRFPTGTVSDRETILIPGSTPPAIIGRLMGNNTTTGRHLIATLFDLSRRGWFIIQEEKKEKNGFFSSEKTLFRVQKEEPQPEEALSDWEKMIVNHVNSQIDNGHDDLEEIFKEGDFKISKWFSEWKKKIKVVYDEKNWIDKESYKGVFLNSGVQLILLVASITLLILSSNKLALAGIFVTALTMAASAAIVRRTKEGQETYKRWKAYRDGLKHADKRTIRMEMLDRHFIYAMALHLSENQIGKVVQSANDSETTIFPWIILIPGSSHTPASVAETVTTLAATSTSTFSSTSGGAGASAGAAGGGASGGAG